MKITIDTDGKSTEPAALTATTAIPAVAAEDAGGAPAASASLVPADAASEDGGGPPAWLVEAVNRAATSDGNVPAVAGEYQDAGSGPA